MNKSFCAFVYPFLARNIIILSIDKYPVIYFWSNIFSYIDSEDSDGEGGLGNVSRVIIRPPGHSGKAKRGHLCFDAAFETGNLGRADLVGEFEYDLFLRPDTCNPRYRFWFNFTVDNVKQDQVKTVFFKYFFIKKNKFGIFLCQL